jgi:Ca2+-binding EF-hand superfamily protein
MDLDYDGVLSEEDIETFIKRYAYFDARKSTNEVQSMLQTVVRQDNGDAFSNFEKTVLNSKSIDLLTIGQKRMFETLVNGMKDEQVKTLNPIMPLTEDKFDHILKDLRIRLQHKGLSYEDFFNLLDVDHNGFITITDFSENVNKVMNLSQPAKDGFFSFIDKK